MVFPGQPAASFSGPLHFPCQKLFSAASPFFWFCSPGLRCHNSCDCLALIDLWVCSLMNKFAKIYSMNYSFMLTIFSYLTDIFDGVSVKLGRN